VVRQPGKMRQMARSGVRACLGMVPVARVGALLREGRPTTAPVA
jgi:hypothetical protein